MPRMMLLSLLAAAALGLGACGSSSGAPTDPAPGARVGQVAGYTPTSANEEGYWYSRYNMMSLTMQSGLGESFMPAMDQVAMAMQLVSQNPADPAMMPTNPALLRIIYAGGDPAYLAAPNPMDFGTLRWTGGPAHVTTEATAWTVVKEIEWAKLFHVDAHFGVPTDTFGATQRLTGVMLGMMVKMQLAALQQEPARFVASARGDAALLIAYADAAEFYGATALPGSTTNRHADPVAAAAYAALASQQFQQVVASTPTGASELSTAIQAVVWYASIATDPAERVAARRAIVAWADALTDEPATTPVARAHIIRGLVEAGRVTGDAFYLDRAAAGYQALSAGFDQAHGVLAGTERLTTDGIATVAGALNASGLFLGDRIDQAALTRLFGAWWEGTVNLSGFQIASPAIPDFKGAFETLNDPLFLRYPGQPIPAAAGGAHGIAPVFAASVTWTGTGWQTDRSWFDTAGAMHASNEFIWFHNDEVNGFPDVTLP